MRVFQRVRMRVLCQVSDDELFAEIKDRRVGDIEIASRDVALTIIARRIVAARVDFAAQPDEVCKGTIPRMEGSQGRTTE